MQELLRRYFWVVVVLTVIGAATFAAKTTNHVIEGKYLADPKHSPKVKPPAPAPATSTAARSKIGQPLLERNMFCATCTPPVTVAVGPTGPVDPNMVVLTSLPLALIATHVAEPKNAKDASNFATVLNTGTQVQGGYWVGSEIPGAGKVVGVHYNYVDFTNAATGRTERVSLTGEIPPPPPVAVAAVEPPPADGDDLTAAIDAGIKKIDDTTYEIDRNLVEKVLANPMALAKGARVMLSSKNGEPNGFKMYAVRPNSVFSKLGFSNGDTLNVVNGMQLNSMDRAMEVYAKVRDASSLQVEITRRGKPVTLNYTVR